jgi:hypothetical protein
MSLPGTVICAPGTKVHGAKKGSEKAMKALLDGVAKEVEKKLRTQAGSGKKACKTSKRRSTADGSYRQQAQRIVAKNSNDILYTLQTDHKIAEMIKTDGCGKPRSRSRSRSGSCSPRSRSSSCDGKVKKGKQRKSKRACASPRGKSSVVSVRNLMMALAGVEDTDD